MGRVVGMERRGGATHLDIQGSVVTEGTSVGDSIAVNGVCLTVISIDGNAVAMEAVPETLRRTTLGELEVGSAVNLERAVRADRPFGGHYVQGHVDGTATVASMEPDGEARTVRFAATEELLRYVVPKGYVALDGVSLTIVDVDDESFSVTLVPHTRQQVTLGDAQVGHAVNVEVDVLGKYVERVVGSRLDAFEARLNRLEGKTKP